MKFHHFTLAVPLLALFACTDRVLLTEPAGAHPSADVVAQSTVQVVTNLLDDGSEGSLRRAVTSAGSGQDITFDPSLAGGTITLVLGELVLDKSLTIVGPTGGITISAGGNSRVMRVPGTYQVVLDNLTIRDGNASNSAGGIDGGGIQNVGGNLTIRNSTVTNNWAPFAGGGVHVVNGSLVVENSTIANNGVHTDMVQRTDFGGGIYSFRGTVSVFNSTVSGNSADHAGGMGNWEGTLTVVHGTIADNGAEDGGGILIVGSTGFPVITSLVNTIVAANFATTASLGPDIRTFSLDGNPAAVQVNVSHSIVGTTTGHSLSGPLIGVSAGFELDGFGKAKLADNGGPTSTHAVVLGSPAIDAADATACAAPPVNGRDQRGVARPQGAGCDIGAFEFGGAVAPPPPTVAFITVSESGSVDKKTGVAYATGTMSCPTPGIVQLEVHLTQEQVQRRLKVTVSGSTTVSVPCSGLTSWAAAVPGGNGVFVNANATLSAATTNVSPAAQAAGLTRLFWSK
jgi:hypothetical protein